MTATLTIKIEGGVQPVAVLQKVDDDSSLVDYTFGPFQVSSRETILPRGVWYQVEGPGIEKKHRYSDTLREAKEVVAEAYVRWLAEELK